MGPCSSRDLGGIPAPMLSYSVAFGQDIAVAAAGPAIPKFALVAPSGQLGWREAFSPVRDTVLTFCARAGLMRFFNSNVRNSWSCLKRGSNRLPRRR